MTLMAACLAAPVMADPLKDNEYKTMHSMGCMLLGECTDGVNEVHSLLDVSSEYKNYSRFTVVAQEFNHMLSSLNQVGVKVYI